MDAAAFHWRQPPAGLPLLIAGLEAFLIERERMFALHLQNRMAGVEELTEVIKRYTPPDVLVQDVAVLIEARMK